MKPKRWPISFELIEPTEYDSCVVQLNDLKHPTDRFAIFDPIIAIEYCNQCISRTPSKIIHNQYYHQNDHMLLIYMTVLVYAQRIKQSTKKRYEHQIK